MRQIRSGDLVALGEVLACVPAGLWPLVCQEVIARADIADRYRKRLGRRHPILGDGTLHGALASAWPRKRGGTVGVGPVLTAARVARGNSLTLKHS